MPKVWLSSTVMTPSLPTFSSASAIIEPISLSAAEIAATLAMAAGSVSTFFDWLRIDSTAASTACSMPCFRTIGLAPAATLRRPSRTMAHASTVAVVVPSPATSSVFFATSLTSSAPIFSYGSSRSISLAMDTPSFVIVGAPHFFSSTTLRPFGPSVTRTASASLFMPASSARRACSSYAICFGITENPLGSVVAALFRVRAGRWQVYLPVSTLRSRVLTHVGTRVAASASRETARAGGFGRRSGARAYGRRLMRKRFTAAKVRLDGKTATSLEVPSSSRPRARAQPTPTGAHHSGWPHVPDDRSRRTATSCFVPLNRENRTAAGVKAGDAVAVTIEIGRRDPRPSKSPTTSPER